MNDRLRHKVDYDRLAPTYNQRFEDNERSGTAAALLALVCDQSEQLGRAPRILEAGCGTGRWLSELASLCEPAACGQAVGLSPSPLTGRICHPERSATESKGLLGSREDSSTPLRFAQNDTFTPAPRLAVYGLDLSAGMLGQARERRGELRLVRGRAGRLPFADRCFDLVYAVNAIHHYGEPRRFVAEARRLLRSGGRLAVIGMDPHGRRESWYVYRYFEGVYEADLARFPTWQQIQEWMAEEGLDGVSCRIIERYGGTHVGRAVLDDPFLRQHSCSQLALLSEADYRAGLRRIEDALDQAEACGETLTFSVDTPLALIVGHNLPIVHPSNLPTIQ